MKIVSVSLRYSTWIQVNRDELGKRNPQVMASAYPDDDLKPVTRVPTSG